MFNSRASLLCRRANGPAIFIKWFRNLRCISPGPLPPALPGHISCLFWPPSGGMNLPPGGEGVYSTPLLHPKQQKLLLIFQPRLKAHLPRPSILWLSLLVSF